MTLSRSVAVPGMNDEYEAFAALIESLTPEQWNSPTRCEGWTVADVAGHVVGQLSDVVALRLDGLGTVGAGIEALWFDTYLHADDIRNALGMPSARGKGEMASLSHIADQLTEQGWASADLRFGELGTYSVSGGGGRQIEGVDALQFILVSTGRSDPSALGLDETVNIYRA